MYSTSHPVSSSMNGMGGSMMDDGTGTINPAALNTPVAVLPSPASMNASTASPRGVKRSRSPEQYSEAQGGSAEDEQRRKRGRPPKSRLSGGENELPAVHAPQQNPQQAMLAHPQTPQKQPQSLPPQNPPAAQASPPKANPTKTVVKALPTVRDHTTDQLTPEQDEYIPREYDESGEKKVSPTGRPLEGREYRCKTFLVPNRGDKLFMLATECARILGYRDSYLLFNKNRSLFKIIATQAEKDDLIGQEILPYSYRSRQIAIVTAKSMFRQFGSRVVVNGRRVRDDYWEAKARKQGFTEDDLAGEKRPGGSKAREAQAAEAAHAAALGHSQDVVYSSGPGHVPIDAHGHPQIMQAGMGVQMGQNLAPQLPMISLAPSEDMRLREYGNVPRPRQEITGQPYADRSQPSSMSEIMNHAAHTAEFSKAVNQQQRQRSKQLDEYWKQTREAPPSSTIQAGQEPTTMAQAAQVPAGTAMPSGQQPMMPHQNSQMLPQGYAQQQTPNPSASPARGMQAQQQMRPDQQQQHQHQHQQAQQQANRSSSLPYGSTMPQQGSYGYGQGQQMGWGQPPGQPPQHPMAQYSPQSSHQTQSPHQSQSPHQHHPAAPPPGPPGPVQHGGQGMGYQGMPQGMPQGYGGMQRGMYAGGQPQHGTPQQQQQQQAAQQAQQQQQQQQQQAAQQAQQQAQQQHSPTPHAYMQQTTGAGGAPLQGWAQPPGQQAGHNGQSWSTY